MIASQMVRTADDLSAFGGDALWVVLLKALFIFVVLVLLTLFNIWWERRVVARMQHRIGPNVHGPFGLLQSLADGVKLALKEDITPKAADKVVFLLAPVIADTRSGRAPALAVRPGAGSGPRSAESRTALVSSAGADGKRCRYWSSRASVFQNVSCGSFSSGVMSSSRRTRSSARKLTSA